MGRVEFEQLRLLEKESLLSLPPQVEIIAITASPPNKKREEEKNDSLAAIQKALAEGDIETAKVHLMTLNEIFLEERVLSKLGSSPTILAGESARSCYSSSGILTWKDFLDPRHAKITDQVIESTRKAGHLTTRQHANIVFGLSRISRSAIHDVFHPHPFYNSEQVSQRYVAVKEGSHTIPAMKEPALTIYQESAQRQMAAYERLRKLLEPTVAEEYYRIFPARKGKARLKRKNEGDITKKAQEIARYVLGIDTHAFMYHTINTLTLLRYFRTCQAINVLPETRMTIYEMVRKVAEIDPKFLQEIEDPVPLEETTEFQTLQNLRARIDPTAAQEFIEEFDPTLEGKTSKLIDFYPSGETTLADAVRAVLGIAKARLSDEEAIRLALDPGKNKLLGDILNLTTLSPIAQAMHVLSYTFARKISHTADSQDQRHRMVPAARPILATHYTGEPDSIIPELIRRNPEAMEVYQEITGDTFETVNRLL